MREEQLEVPTRMVEECVAKSGVYTRSRMEQLRDYNITIEFLSIGCIIRVGCRSIPFSTVKHGMAALNEYVNDPVLLTKIWNEKFNADEE